MKQAANELSATDIIGMIDHAVLSPDCTRDDILDACKLGREYALGSICVPPAWVSLAFEELRGAQTSLSSVVGFPNGYATTRTKTTEACALTAHGCAELDMVCNISFLRSGQYAAAQADIASVVEHVANVCEGMAVVKVIVETCYLSGEQIRQAVECAAQAGADFVKTSTGFGPEGATVENVRLLRDAAPEHMGVKAAGGIRTLQDLLNMVEAGANRIGTSSTEAIIEELDM
ncbi:MAG: deoxyribose-phosphate aldolase [Armatimonadota bacterium]